MSKRVREDSTTLIYKAYTARRVASPLGCCDDHWLGSSKYFAFREDAEAYMMDQIVAHFAALDTSWFREHGIENVDDTYDAYCEVMDRWMHENDDYDYCIEEIELH
jgi:hypothetical protein